MSRNLVLVINPGSTSGKVALFGNGELISEKVIRYTAEEIGAFKSINDQQAFRKIKIDEYLNENDVKKGDIIAVVGRGGLSKPISGGTYLVNKDMLEDLASGEYGSHASNLGASLAQAFADEYGVSAYTVDPVVVDEMHEIARISGLKGIERRSVFHALNSKAAARAILAEQYEKYNVIVAHMGGGISVSAHQYGKVIDVVNGIDGEGAYSPERTGGLPLITFAKKIIEESLSLEQIKKILAGEGGIKSYTGEIDMRIVEEKALAGDMDTKNYLDGMCYQVAKCIGEMAIVLQGNVDVIILTGGISYSAYVVEYLKSYVNWIAHVEVVPGEKEMEALYDGVMRVLNKQEEAQIY
ncbi:butyrate kinase [Macrococcus hajekii]|uniref:Probable butyrate kinase n=1 Tax=Macrococcus hajekii TaxID=198482 RepID=A0A4R6BJT3_9STAP|nr:butyrate kinase [Macrococcus hajekii]TDM01965.1 butyrate kinase [Macrococcus hajekii]GGB08893.1 putative butyrate kinase [Macrococcus hajekii]